MKVHIIAVALAGLAGFAPTPTSAEVYYPWCAQYGSGRNGIGATVCSFITFDQCMATVRGTGGFCSNNWDLPPINRSHSKKRSSRPET